MKTKKLVIFGISAALLIAVVAAAINAVFTVSSVQVNFRTFSEQGKTEAAQLQEQLEETFLGRSTTLLSLDDVRAEVKKFPWFKVESIEKKFPSNVVLSVSEREETFAYRRENGVYAILDETGAFVYDSADNVNRNGGENILLSGFEWEIPSVGETASGEFFASVVGMTDAFTRVLGNVRANVESVALVHRTIEGDYFQLKMREGVMLEIHLPQNKTKEKSESMAEAYIELSETQKTYGYLDLIELQDGTFHEPSYSDDIYLDRK